MGVGAVTNLIGSRGPLEQSNASWLAGVSATIYQDLVSLHLPLGTVLIGVGLGLIVYRTIVSLERRPSTEGAGTVRISVVLPSEPATESEPSPGIEPPLHSVRVFGKDGDHVVQMQGAGEHPAPPVRRARRFVVVLIAAFAILSTPLLLFYPTLFGPYDHLVAEVGTLLYWPLAWPGIYTVSVQTLVVPDYVFPMYLAFMGAFVVASGLLVNRPPVGLPRRLLALATVATYVGVELVLDALFFTVPGTALRDFALLVRVLTGGAFMAFLTFTAFHLPHPQRITPRFPRDRRAITVFLGIGISSVAISAALLLLVLHLLQVQGVVFGFTLLLLIPVLTIPLFCAFARPLYFRNLRKYPTPPLSEYHPAVSVIIPAYNEEEWIVETIESVDRAAADYPGSVQIVVGNDGSTDLTLDLARDAIQRLTRATGVVVDLPHGGKSNALNGALALATGEIVLRVDGDTVISNPPGFAAMISHFADPEVGGVQGAIHPRQRTGWTRKFRALEISWLHYMLRPASMATRSAEVLDGLFSAFRRKDLVDLGGWVPWNGEDSEMSMRVQRLGYKIRMEFGALALEDVPSNYDTLRKQRVRWSRGILMANGQHYFSLLGPTPEFGGLGVLFWFLLLIRSGVRSLVYVFLLLLILFLGVPGLIYTLILLGIATAIRAVPIGYFLVKMGRRDVLPWIPLFPIGNILKQTFRFEAFGTLGPGAVAEYA
jgi:cellulose synthase/poly-beta-1,6-N-acetylglucosamine synthase-like glycosyltransferase